MIRPLESFLEGANDVKTRASRRYTATGWRGAPRKNCGGWQTAASRDEPLCCDGKGGAPAKQKENSQPEFQTTLGHPFLSSFFNPPSDISPLFFFSKYTHLLISITPSFTMGFTDFVSDAGLTVANNFLSTRSYIVG